LRASASPDRGDLCHLQELRRGLGISDTSLVRRIVSWAKRVRFDVEEAIVEMRGLCGECKSALTAERS
jgi:Fe2+ or Zn2+ uptake regulation protein